MTTLPAVLSSSPWKFRVKQSLDACITCHCCLVAKVMSSSFATPWIVVHQAPLSRDFPGKNTEVGCHFLSPGDLPDPGIKPKSPAWQADSLPLTHQGISHIYHTSQQTHPEWPACLKTELGILGLKVINTTGLPCGKKVSEQTMQNHNGGAWEEDQTS